MINSAKVLYSPGLNDECYTPRYGVLPIVKYIPKNKIVWCPFDNEDSEFVKVFKERNIPVVCSHIHGGQDFYTYEPERWDIIISNPPFTNKRKIFERALSFNKPFALIMSNTWLNDAAPKQYTRQGGSMNENVIKMARLMGSCKAITCEDCLSQSKKLFGDNKCALIEYAEVLDKADYRKQSDTVKEFSERILKDISDAIDHNNCLVEAFSSISPETHNTVLITNNACKGVYDTVTAIAKEYGVEE